MTAGKVVAAVFGSILALIALGLLIGGGTLFWAQETLQDADGFFNSPSYRLEADGYAIVAEEIDLASYPGDWWPAKVDASARLNVRAGTGQEVFIGIGLQEDVDDYLGSVSHSVVRRLGDRWDDVRLVAQSGGVPEGSPADANIWVALIQGEGEQTLNWEPQRGKWAVVIMNADATTNVAVSAVGGVRIPILRPISIGLMIAAFVFAAFAALLLVAATRSTGAPAPVVAKAVTGGTYPVTVTGVLDERLSPFLWLIKWFLVIPHCIVLAFLWAAFGILTFFAWIAILFTGRYPKGIFDFNVGVMRWTWRVSFYTYSALATDRYPPFTLRDVDYPARLDVAYPEQLSRGLALVKWWLLAIPHYIIVGLFTSGLWAWTMGDHVVDNAVTKTGGGLVSILAIIAGFILLFTGRYPRGLFDLLMGLNRWVLRVGTYVSLMHDDYPPFRLDMGGEETASARATEEQG
ncbi:DUF4389 domain-containing protein [Candidatus Bipolaricaulota bacterium]|nr:DUF4389 domain-containing protein [Candidatus Bipolaricaulota bacterium]